MTDTGASIIPMTVAAVTRSTVRTTAVDLLRQTPKVNAGAPCPAQRAHLFQHIQLAIGRGARELNAPEFVAVGVPVNVAPVVPLSTTSR